MQNTSSLYVQPNHHLNSTAGAIGGASYSKGLSGTGYNNINSLESEMIAARLVVEHHYLKLNLGYTNVLDEADLVAQWRGFPTSGYTRSMGRYNWQANTQSYRLELQMNANDEGVYKKPFVQMSV